MPKKKHRKNIPKAVKDRLWDITFGPSAGEGECYTCGAVINSKRFEAGHIISVYNGGKDIIDNLKCICSTCNKSMGTEDMNEFKKKYFNIEKDFYEEKHIKMDEDEDIDLENKLKDLDKFFYKK